MSSIIKQMSEHVKNTEKHVSGAGLLMIQHSLSLLVLPFTVNYTKIS